MLVGTKQRLSRSRRINIKVDIIELETVDVSKLLGVNIDCCLTWSNHLEIVSNKISKKLGVLKRLKHFMSCEALIKIYNSIIFPHFNYCCTVWAGAKNHSNISRLVKLQKRAGRIILNIQDITTASSIIFQTLNWMPIDDYFVYRKCILTYKVLNNMTTEYLNVFHFVNEVSTRTTRQSSRNLLFVPRAKTEYYKRSFHISSCYFWNELPSDIRGSTSLEMFKSKYLNLYFNSRMY